MNTSRVDAILKANPDLRLFVVGMGYGGSLILDWVDEFGGFEIPKDFIPDLLMKLPTEQLDYLAEELGI